MYVFLFIFIDLRTRKIVVSLTFLDSFHDAQTHSRSVETDIYTTEIEFESLILASISPSRQSWIYLPSLRDRKK